MKNEISHRTGRLKFCFEKVEMAFNFNIFQSSPTCPESQQPTRQHWLQRSPSDRLSCRWKSGIHGRPGCLGPWAWRLWSWGVPGLPAFCQGTAEELEAWALQQPIYYPFSIWLFSVFLPCMTVDFLALLVFLMSFSSKFQWTKSATSQEVWKTWRQVTPMQGLQPHRAYLK